MKKYLQIFKMSWQNTFVYRLNFFMWRVRRIFLLLGKYFFWHAVYHFNTQIGSYDKTMMLTYIIGTSIMGTMVFASSTQKTSVHIASGRLNIYLTKPLKYFICLFSHDLAKKALNFLFLFFELGLIFLVLKPPFFIQTNTFHFFTFIIFTAISISLYFYLSLLISLIAFWYPEHSGWPARFLFMVVIQFLSGGFLPLDILPKPIFAFLKLLPSTYLRFFPLQVYLGKINPAEILQGFALMIFWLISLMFLVKLIWQKGLKKYAALGI